MTEGSQTKRRGPKPKALSALKRANLTFRVRDGMREKLINAGEASGRSVSEEIERRLEDSFRINEEFGTGGRLDLLRLVSSVLRMTEWLTKDNSYKDRTALIEAKVAITVLLDLWISSMRTGSSSRLIDILADAGAKGHAAATMQFMGSGLDPDNKMPPGGEKAFGIFAQRLVEQGASDPLITALASLGKLPSPARPSEDTQVAFDNIDALLEAGTKDAAFRDGPAFTAALSNLKSRLEARAAAGDELAGRELSFINTMNDEPQFDIFLRERTKHKTEVGQ